MQMYKAGWTVSMSMSVPTTRRHGIQNRNSPLVTPTLQLLGDMAALAGMGSGRCHQTAPILLLWEKYPLATAIDLRLHLQKPLIGRDRHTVMKESMKETIEESMNGSDRGHEKETRPEMSADLHHTVETPSIPRQRDTTDRLSALT